jgi:hypothetical protein
MNQLVANQISLFQQQQNNNNNITTSTTVPVEVVMVSSTPNRGSSVPSELLSTTLINFNTEELLSEDGKNN